MEFQGQGGIEHFGISLGMGGLDKTPPVVGYGYFWNRPLTINGD